MILGVARVRVWAKVSIRAKAKVRVRVGVGVRVSTHQAGHVAHTALLDGRLLTRAQPGDVAGARLVGVRVEAQALLLLRRVLLEHAVAAGREAGVLHVVLQARDHAPLARHHLLAEYNQPTPVPHGRATEPTSAYVLRGCIRIYTQLAGRGREHYRK